MLFNITINKRWNEKHASRDNLGIEQLFFALIHFWGEML